MDSQNNELNGRSNSEKSEHIDSETDEKMSGEVQKPNKVRRRVKVRKRVRIKKKPNSKKKLKKYGERAFWIVLVIGFIISLIVMIVQLDISDKKFKKQRKKKSASWSY